LFARALAILEKSVAPDSHRLANPHLGLARTALARERPDEAVPHAEQAVRLREAADTAPYELALARFTLARALWESDRDRPRALRLAEQARSTYREMAGEKDMLAQVEAWLAERPVARSTSR
jgi:tetratricopeptide (TPR) repeat protein